jgi:hypothetical protein
MSKKEEKVWQFLLANRKADYAEVAEACGVDIDFVKRLVGRIGSGNWREEIETQNVMGRAAVLDTAKDYVTRDRAADHGDMEDNFRTIASYWNTHLGIDFIEPQDVAVMMNLLKVARIRQNEKHLDNWIDACGYMACGGEIVSK